MAVAYKIVDSNIIGASVLANIDTAATVKIGSLVKGLDTSTADYGEAEFEYIKYTGSAAIAAGDLVVFDRGAKAGVGAAQAAAKGCVGIAMAAVTAPQAVAGVYGWVLVRGVHDGANIATGATAGLPIYLTSTVGRGSGTVAAGFKCDGMFERVSTSASNVGVVELEWPVFSGNG